MVDRNYNPIHAALLVNISVVYEYFRLIKNKDINRLLTLFVDDAVIFEPFSKIYGGIQGKSSIKAFLEVALMANEGVQYDIRFKKDLIPDSSNKSNINEVNSDDNENQITALVTFERRGRVKARFTFKLSSEENCRSQKQKKIESLHINFIE